jgi:primosomal protein N' (replication factor Y)
MNSAAAKPAQTFPPDSAVAVLLPLPLAGAYDYRVGDVSVRAGDVVVAPLGSRHVVGVVWGPASQSLPPARLKPLLGVKPGRALPQALRDFVQWVAGYTLSPPGAVLKMTLPVLAALEPPTPLWGWRLTAVPPPGIKMTPGRCRVLEAVRTSPPLATPDLAREAGVGTAVVKGLAEAGCLERVALPPPAPFDLPKPDHPGPQLSPGQRQAADALADARDFSVFLLDGVTGSGKTEVYFEAVAQTLRRGRQVLVLLPEIALSAQWLDRFRARFGAEPAVWHSELGDATRRDTWRAVAAGQAPVVVGARSALFLPFPDLGLIVADEEHDGAFKQEDGVVYHARDMAVVRGRIGGFPVILASATPSLETLANVQAGRYRRLHLPDRHGAATMPDMNLVDLRKTPPPRGFWLAPPLVKAVEQTLADGEQAMLFLNRRGYAPLTLCRTCGHRLQCPHCTAWLVSHKSLGRLICHHCGYALRLPPECPQCQAEDSFAACGPGIERIAEEAAHLFPAARIAVMASDTVAGPAAAAEFVRRVEAHEIDLLVGTQIVAKGYHFPLLTLVGVVDGDLGLEGGDLRAAERTFQLLSQVSGRAGRAGRPGRVMLQTFQPEHPVMRALAQGDRDSFVAAEAEARRAAGMPPFGRLAALIVSGPDDGAVDAYARLLSRHAPTAPGIQVIGPAPAPMALLRGRHRRRFLVKADRSVALQALLQRWLADTPPKAPIRVQVDIDPYSFF